MPLGIQRLNAKRSQPNANIVFIKALPGPGEETARGFLERIAAQCVPIMRKNHISVMTLEEYEPNREFVGRNFNAGEVVQLVLRSGRSGRWLPFEYVQMVMMHELAHCKQMNHSRAFWAVRNQYAAQMEDLWREGYTGEGIWGRGASLATGGWERDTVRPGEDVLPEHVCGGTYRSRRKKRKTAAAVSYQERKRRRIQNKFGGGGTAVGADEETRARLEKGKGKKVLVRPRVAGCARGRELRAAAALARFEQQAGAAEAQTKEEHGTRIKSEEGTETETDSESESGSEVADGSSDSPQAPDAQDALDADGTRILDSTGRALVKVCDEDGDQDGADARTELSRLRDMLDGDMRSRTAPRNTAAKATGTFVKDEPLEEEEEEEEDVARLSKACIPDAPPSKKEDGEDEPGMHVSPAAAQRATSPSPSTTCAMCSFGNDTTATTCGVCAHVLGGALTPEAWRCADARCRSGGYVNSGDCGVCGLCGRRRGG